MGDPGFIPGMIGLAIQAALNQIFHHINTAVRCRKELGALKHLLVRIQHINREMQEYRRGLNSGKIHTSSSHHALPSAVNSWLNELNGLLQEASDMAQHCAVPSSHRLISRYRTSRRITRLISAVKEHLDSTPLIAFAHQLQQDVANRQGLQQIKERIDSLSPKFTTSIPAGTSRDCSPISSSAMSKMKYIEESLILGQDKALTILEDFISPVQGKNVSRIGLVGMGGSGKTLLLKRFFNSPQVQSLFSVDLMLWLTVSKTPSFKALRNDLLKQISLRIDERLDGKEEEDEKIWLHARLRENRFALFLDDVWETSANSLLGELGVPPSSPHNSSIIIVTSRSGRVLLQLGVPISSTIQIQELKEDDSWQLFSSHAFPYSDGNLPMSIDKEIARCVCKECGGLPLALKVIGQAMAGVTQSREWEFALNRLRNAGPIKHGDLSDSLYGRLRLSYDALADFDISLQLCFLHLAAVPQNRVILTTDISMLWIGEGLVAGHDPLEIGQGYVDLLADRCLIEPVQMDIHGKVILFRVHDVLHDLAQQIAEKEEKCFFPAGRGLQEFPADECSLHVRISLMDNRFRCVPNSFRGPHIHSLLMHENLDLKEIPKQVIGSMISLRVLDLSCTSLHSLPNSIGDLKYLVCLRLSSTFIKRLPNSITNLKNLQILDISNSNIKELPSSIFKLTSLKLLDISNCKHLESMPYGISQVTSLEYFNACGCPNAKIKMGQNKYKTEILSISMFGSLKNLKRLELGNNGEITREGALGNMKQMEHLCLELTRMKSLPHDITSMSKLMKLFLRCPQLLEIQDTFCKFRHLSYISLLGCSMLKQLPDLHKLASLKKLEIVDCPSIDKLPKEFGETGAFPKLEVFSLVALHKLKELPVVEEEAMSSLKTFSLVQCEALQMLPKSYWNLKSVEKIRVYGCSMVIAKMEENFIDTDRKVQTRTLSTADTEALQKRFQEMIGRHEELHYDEFWCNEPLQFLFDTYYQVRDVNYISYLYRHPK